MYKCIFVDAAFSLNCIYTHSEEPKYSNKLPNLQGLICDWLNLGFPENEELNVLRKIVFLIKFEQM